MKGRKDEADVAEMAIAGSEVFAAGVTLAGLGGQPHATVEGTMLRD